MEQLRPISRTPLSTLSLGQTRQYGQKPTMDQVGKAFETLFMQTMMKSMRDAQIEGGLLDSEHSKPFQSMLDGIYSEMSVKTTKLGLSEAINRQFTPKNGQKAAPVSPAQLATLSAAQAEALSGGAVSGLGGNLSSGVSAFPTSDLASSLSAQKSASIKTNRLSSLPISAPAQRSAPKFLNGE